MSNKALNWAFEAPIENTGAKFVLVVLADHGSDHAGENWTCFPSIERIQQFTAQGFRTVQRHLDWLEKEGWISRRRRSNRPGGKQGVYDYTLHRERRAPANLAGDDTGQCGAADRPKSTTSPANLADAHIEEPSLEHPTEPTGGDDHDDDFQQVFDAWLLKDPSHTSRPKALAEWRQWVDRIDPWRLRTAALRYLAEDADVRRCGPKWLHKWLSEELWRGWLPAEGTQANVVRHLPHAVFEGPPELRAAVVAWGGDAFAAAYLDPAAWDAAGQSVTPRTGVAFDRLRDALGRELRDNGIRLLDPRSAASTHEAAA